MLLNLKTNIQFDKEFSVTEISQRIKEILESNFNYIRIKGEISGLKIAASGHGYFNLKDSINLIACTCWRPVLAKLNFKIEDGMEVIMTGKISGYGPQSKYQFAVDFIEPLGVGAMLKIFEERKLKLAKEGLFNPEFKKFIPLFPKKIGIITSITGAVIQDIIHRVADRYPLNIIIWPVTVQGATAANEVIAGIEGFNNTESVKPDLIIIARGGGSIEDLWAFNEELLARAVFASKIPIISAIGHEADFTLIDFVADLRAPTPTAAAELATPLIVNLKYTLNTSSQHLINSINRLIKYNQKNLEHYERVVKNPALNLQNLQQRVDEAGFRLEQAPLNLLKIKHGVLQSFNLVNLTPKKYIEYKVLQVEHLKNLLISLIKFKAIKEYENKLELFASILTSLDYNRILKRGFALIKSNDGKVISSINETKNIDNYDIKFFDGELMVKKI